MEDATPKEAPWNANYGVVGSGDHRLAFSRQFSLNAATPRLARSDSSISMPPQLPLPKRHKLLYLTNRPMRRLALLLALNVAYSATELAIGLFTGRIQEIGGPGCLYKCFYRNAEDMNYHSVCLHVLADSIRSCSVHACIATSFKATGNILLQIAPGGNVPPSAFMKCCRQITDCEDVWEVCLGRFWELVPGQSVGSLFIRVKKCAEEQSVLEYVHGLYQDLGIHDVTVQTDES
ncbi:hypothetical protein PR202_gb10163 [Eleusine coracana subsp. coracana]|uniref:Uncharacterized protein n=1 Tax=Eleusine coracana subsp. coracana TaxID=191504 RepID=A0AAV5EJR0_ELECO|nr:hypothetical protein PR202_gb10163 [Eleusine coracana subsp. coracana]